MLSVGQLLVFQADSGENGNASRKKILHLHRGNNAPCVQGTKNCLVCLETKFKGSGGARGS